MDIIEQLKEDEAYRRYPYLCSAGVLTIGYGRNIDEKRGGSGLSEPEASALLLNDVRKVEYDMVDIFPGWREFDQVRKNALVNMRFQLGAGGIRKFRLMIGHINNGQWIMAAREAIDSRWARQTPERAYRVAKEIKDGVALS